MVKLTAQERDILGKKTRVLRKNGFLPGVLYGGKNDSLPITISLKDFLKVWKSAGESTLVDLSVDGKGDRSVLIHDIAFDPITDIPLHVDFYEARADRVISVHVPIVFAGESEAVKALGGVLVKVIHEIEVEAIPKDLPHEITVDISKLATFEDVISVADISVPHGVKINAEEGAVLAKVAAPRTEEEIADLSETEEIKLDEIPVVEKGKKEESEEPEEKQEA